MKTEIKLCKGKISFEFFTEGIIKITITDAPYAMITNDELIDALKKLIIK